MSIVIPGYRPVHAPRGVQPRRGCVGAELMLTPMVDMFTLLVLYLVQSFGSTGEILHISKELQMPTARHGQQMMLRPVVSIAGGVVLVDGVEAARLPDARDTGPLHGLETRLRDLAAISDTFHGGAAGVHKSVNVQADRLLPYGELRRVLETCQLAGYGGVHLAVVHGSPAATPPRKPEDRFR